VAAFTSFTAFTVGLSMPPKRHKPASWALTADHCSSSFNPGMAHPHRQTPSAVLSLTTHRKYLSEARVIADTRSLECRNTRSQQAST
jgi:hypothetical protein